MHMHFVKRVLRIGYVKVLYTNMQARRSDDMEDILIMGDLLPTPSNYAFFENGDVLALLGTELLDMLKEKVYIIANLEGPLTEATKGINKSGPILKGTENSINGIKQMQINCCSLANNHILDYGMEGLQSTIRIMRENGIDVVGAGDTLEKAAKPFVFLVNGLKVGVYSCAEYEFTIATNQTGGANPFDSLEIVDHINDLRTHVDYVIVLYHGGKEHYRYPAPYVQKRCRKLIEKGADLVVCQHSHCIGCKEEYLNGTIVYGQGNFLFDRGENEFRNSGLIIKVNPYSNNIEYIPIMKHGNAVRLANIDKKQEILKGFMKRSEEIMEEGIVEKKYKEFANQMIQAYDTGSLGVLGRILRLLKLQKLAKMFFGKGDSLRITNNLRCEAHRDIYIEGLKERMHLQ